MKIDGRTLDHQSSETIRLMAVKRIKEDGEKPSDVIKSYGFSHTTVYIWLKKYENGGYDALKSTKGTGRPQTLNQKEMQKLRKMLIGKDPRQYGFDFGLWSLQLICELVADKFDKDISIPTAHRILHKLNITSQRPLSRAYEQDPKAFVLWKKKEYPKITCAPAPCAGTRPDSNARYFTNLAVGTGILSFPFHPPPVQARAQVN